MKRERYTDLALEAAEAIYEKESEGFAINGVEMTKENKNGATVTWVKVLDESGERSLGKPAGNYITIESDAMRKANIDAHEEIIGILTDSLAKLINLGGDAEILIVGLGNRSVTPDALGPAVVSKTLLTRHIFDKLPADGALKVRSVSAIAPGVMGTTGIETFDIVNGICRETKPSLVIAIDALAARRTNRVNATIQICDTGVSPGAGMGNARKIISGRDLGVPVVAIGVPTVVDAATLVNDTLDLFLTSMEGETLCEGQFYDMLRSLEEQDKYNLVKRILEPYSGNMFVTPKEVDSVIDRLSNIIANAINIALHPGITKDDINRFMY